MSLRLTLWIVSLMVSSLAAGQTSTGINCKSSPERCEVTVGGQVLTFGMPKNRVVGLLSSYKLIQDSAWSAEHKPRSLWHVTDNQNAIKGGVKFRGEKLDGAMVIWSPNSNEVGDFAANLLNLLERFSKDGSTKCELTTEKSATPQQEQRVARFRCGLRSIIVEHDHFQLEVQGQKMPDKGYIIETFADW